ncbi:hypothetical protein Golax_009374 [Gossypium laxum]|uniref:Uncharacterized protein n=1 Tax=Gossypium laxum TaxID=34288 RepID=A0A7J9ADF9_9ROSI|nr:hypothetical protein [Gossypium laxum]
MGKASGDRHLALFTFAVYELIVFQKALGYVSVELADFLPIEEFLESEWPLNQLIEEWVQNLSTLTYQEIDQYGYNQCIPTTAGLNRVETSV